MWKVAKKVLVQILFASLLGIIGMLTVYYLCILLPDWIFEAFTFGCKTALFFGCFIGFPIGAVIGIVLSTKLCTESHEGSKTRRKN